MWRVEFSESARKELRKLNQQAQQDILSYLKTRVQTPEDPTRFGKSPKSRLSGLWRYRVQDYHIICRIVHDNVTVLVVRIGHRKDVHEG